MIKFLWSNDFDGGIITASNSADGYPVSNLKHRWHTLHWRSINAANEYIRINLEEAKPIKGLAAINDEYDQKRQHILDNVKDNEKRDFLLAKLEAKRERKLAKARRVQAREERLLAKAILKLDKEKNKALRLASEELERKRSAARRTAAKQEKAVALLSAIVNTAAAIVKALPNIPLSIAVGILGAIQ
ncbi:unnamed protein product [marine sediment metagenome]|uniref:Uncharacterized protein n=1 Tax=marine sediment metagenome TaxID=412755 RepID=X0ZFR7_9ZZZZ